MKKKVDEPARMGQEDRPSIYRGTRPGKSPKAAEQGWNTRPEIVVQSYSEDSEWRESDGVFQRPGSHQGFSQEEVGKNWTTD